MTTMPNETDVLLTLVSDEQVGRDRLDAASDLVLEIVGSEAAHGVALGPVVSCDFAREAIELDFTVKAATPTEVYQRIGVVVAALEGRLPFAVSVETATAAPVSA